MLVENQKKCGNMATQGAMLIGKYRDTCAAHGTLLDALIIRLFDIRCL
jgi:hypothetical protein